MCTDSLVPDEIVKRVPHQGAGSCEGPMA